MNHHLFSFHSSGEVTSESESNDDPTIHLSYVDLAMGNATNPTTVSIQIKCWKTVQFKKERISSTGDDYALLQLLLSYLSMRGDKPGFFVPLE